VDNAKDWPLDKDPFADLGVAAKPKASHSPQRLPPGLSDVTVGPSLAAGIATPATA
jgi:hypothetical protein